MNKFQTLSRSGRTMVASLALAALSVIPAMAQTVTPPTPIDTTGYSAIFTQLSSDLTAVATGPVGIGAFGALTVGLIFKVVWKLYNKAPHALG